ncbi:hypothetical protein ACHZ97_09580 [Lysobacter soli]|uniref:hypothetical protein n=1 Tax=Lysobacter soli TaxID=453783 RepID=UPI0037C7BAB7
MRSLLLCLLIAPAAVLAGSSPSQYSFLSYELLLNGQAVRGAGVVASDQLGFNRWGKDLGTLRLACAEGRRTLSNMPLFEGGIVYFTRKGDQVQVQIRESKIQRVDDEIKRVPEDQCRDLSATEVVLIDRTITVPADTAGSPVLIDIGDGYSLRAITRDVP